jgi:APA family basic amino acid/polyamine antiporter
MWIWFGIPIVCNLLAVIITAFLTWLLVIGIKESANFNSVVVIVKVGIVLMFIAAGALAADTVKVVPAMFKLPPVI